MLCATLVCCTQLMRPQPGHEWTLGCIMTFNEPHDDDRVCVRLARDVSLSATLVLRRDRVAIAVLVHRVQLTFRSASQVAGRVSAVGQVTFDVPDVPGGPPTGFDLEWELLDHTGNAEDDDIDMDDDDDTDSRTRAFHVLAMVGGLRQRMEFE